METNGKTIGDQLQATMVSLGQLEAAAGECTKREMRFGRLLSCLERGKAEVFLLSSCCGSCSIRTRAIRFAHWLEEAVKQKSEEEAKATAAPG